MRNNELNNNYGNHQEWYGDDGGKLFDTDNRYQIHKKFSLSQRFGKSDIIRKPVKIEYVGT